MCAGNAATFYFLPIVLLASVVGLASTLVGFHHLRVWRTDSLAAAAAASLIAWLITLLAFGYVPVIFWRPCFFICPWRWSSLMFSLQSLERQTGVDTGHLIPPSLRRNLCSAYSNKAWTFLKAWWRKIFCKLNKQCRFMMVKLSADLLARRFILVVIAQESWWERPTTFLTVAFCFLYVWDNFSFMGVMGSTTRHVLGHGEGWGWKIFAAGWKMWNRKWWRRSQWSWQSLSCCIWYHCTLASWEVSMGLPTPTTTTRVPLPLVQLPATTLQSVRSISMAQQLLQLSDQHHHTELHNSKSIHDALLLLLLLLFNFNTANKFSCCLHQQQWHSIKFPLKQTKKQEFSDIL